MQKLLVIESDIFKCIQIINYISKNNENIKLYSIAFTYKEAMDIIESKIVDIIILDLKLADDFGTEIIRYIQKNNINKYINSIIVILDKRKESSVLRKNPYINSYIYEPYKIEDIQKNIEFIIKNKTKEIIINKINNELKNLHYNFAYNGTKYLAETIFEIYSKKDSYEENLKRNIYPIIAKKHNKSVNTIHGNIKQATKCMYLDCEEKVINEYFNYSYFTQTKLKEIIYTILNKI